MQKGQKVRVSIGGRVGVIFSDLGGGDFIIQFADRSRLAVNKRHLSLIKEEKPVEEKKPVEEEKQKETGDEEIETDAPVLTLEMIEAMGVSALKAEAKRREITGYSGMNKAALVEAIWLLLAEEEEEKEEEEESEVEETADEQS